MNRCVTLPKAPHWSCVHVCYWACQVYTRQQDESRRQLTQGKLHVWRKPKVTLPRAGCLAQAAISSSSASASIANWHYWMHGRLTGKSFNQLKCDAATCAFLKLLKTFGIMLPWKFSSKFWAFSQPLLWQQNFFLNSRTTTYILFVFFFSFHKCTNNVTLSFMPNVTYTLKVLIWLVPTSIFLVLCACFCI